MSKENRFNLLSTMDTEYPLPFDIDKELLSIDNNYIIVKTALYHFTFLCEDVMEKNRISLQARNARLRNLRRLFCEQSFFALANCLKDTYDILIDHISGKYTLTSFSDFKGRVRRVTGCPYYPTLFSVIKEDIILILAEKTVSTNGCYRNASTNAMKHCSQYLLFLSKLVLSNPDLEEKGLKDYLSFEEENKAHKSWSPYLLSQLSEIMRYWLRDFSYNGLNPSHGPGSTADAGRSIYLKEYALGWDHGLTLAHNWASQYSEDRYEEEGRYSFERCSQLVFVPKNIKKLRSISMEPTTLQFHQQGVMKELYRYFKYSYPLNNILHLQDQHVNKSFAYTASITDEYSTIDLSHASDSVTWDLVKHVFKRVPNLMCWLVGTRSTHTLLPNGERIALAKFAPMGSALCFPVESLIFASIATLSVQLELKRKKVKGESTRGLTRQIKVYGDDIIIPTYASKTCITLLRYFGFTPNEDKSYLEGPFKESCGGNYFAGVDITPLKYSAVLDKGAKKTSGITPQAFSAYIRYANDAYQRGLPLLRLSFVRYLLDAGLSPVFTSEPTQEDRIFSPCATNFHLVAKRIRKCDSELATDLQYDILGYQTSSRNVPACKLNTLARRALIERARYNRARRNDQDDLVLPNGFSLKYNEFRPILGTTSLQMQRQLAIFTNRIMYDESVILDIPL